MAKQKRLRQDSHADDTDAPLADRELLLAALAQRGRRLLTPLQEQFQAAGRVVLPITRAGGRCVTGELYLLHAGCCCGAWQPGHTSCARPHALEKVARRRDPNAGLVVTNGVHCAVPADHRLHDVLTVPGTGCHRPAWLPGRLVQGKRGSALEQSLARRA